MSFPVRPTNPFPSTAGGPNPGGGGGGGGAGGGSQFYNQFNQFNDNRRYQNFDTRNILTNVEQLNQQFNATLKATQHIKNDFRRINNYRFTTIIRSAGEAARSVGMIERAARGSLAMLRRVGSFALRMPHNFLNYRTMIAGAAIGAGVRFAGGAAMDRETNQYRLGRALGLDPTGRQNTRLYSSLLRSAGRMPGVNLGEFVEGAITGARQGIGEQNPAKLGLFARDVAKMIAIFEDIPIDELTTKLSRLNDLFGLSSEATAGMASAVNKLDMMSTASAREILDVATRMSGAASKLGFSPGDTFAWAASARQAGIPNETGGTAFTQIMGRMVDRRFMGSFGKLAQHGALVAEGKKMSREDYVKLLFGTGPEQAGQDVSKAFELVLEGLNAMPDFQAFDYLNKLSLDGQRVRGTMLQLGRVLERFRSFQKAANDEVRTGASLQKSFGEVSETAAAQLDQLKTNVALAAGAYGRGLLPVIKGANRAISDLAMDIQEMVEEDPAAFEAWGERVADSIQFVRDAATDSAGVWEYVKNVAGEKFEQLKAIFMRFGEWLASVAPEVGRKVGEGIATGMTNGLGFSGGASKVSGGLIGGLEWLMGPSLSGKGKEFFKTWRETLDAQTEQKQAGVRFGLDGRPKAPGSKPIDWNLGGLGNILSGLPTTEGGDKARAWKDEMVVRRDGKRKQQRQWMNLFDLLDRNDVDIHPEGLLRGVSGMAMGGISLAGRKLAGLTQARSDVRSPYGRRRLERSGARNLREAMGVPADYNDRIRAWAAGFGGGEGEAEAGEGEGPAARARAELRRRMRSDAYRGYGERTTGRHSANAAIRGGRAAFNRRIAGMRDMANAQWRERTLIAGRAESEAGAQRRRDEESASKKWEQKVETIIGHLATIAGAISGKGVADAAPRNVWKK